MILLDLWNSNTVWNKFILLININLISYTQPFRIRNKTNVFSLFFLFLFHHGLLQIRNSKAMQKKKKKLQSCAIRISKFLRPNSTSMVLLCFVNFYLSRFSSISWTLGERTCVPRFVEDISDTHACVYWISGAKYSSLKMCRLCIET